jgi:tetratricopeptide (TPR) repeat protein
MERLKDKSPSQFISHYSLYREIAKLDSISRIKTAIEIEKECAKGNKRLSLLGRSVKAKIFFYNIKPNDSVYAAQMKRCLNEAIEMEEPYLQAEFGRWYSEMLNTLDQKELALQVAISSLKLHEYLGFENFAAVSIFYLWVGETLLVAGYVPESITYLNRGLQLAKTDTLVRPFRFMFTYNNLGLAYRQLNMHDSALYYFEKLKAYCVEIKRPDWEEIAYKNRLPCFVELGMLDSAKRVANRLFEIAKTSKDPDDEMIAWEMLGKIAVKEKNYEAAIGNLLTSARVNGGKNKRLLNRVYETLAACYETMGQPEKAYPYLKFARAYNDSVTQEKEKFNSRFLVIKAEYDKEQLQLKKLTSEVKSTRVFRNVGIALVLLVAAAMIWGIEKKRKNAEQLRKSAARELDTFKEEIISKNNRIDDLNARLEKQQIKQLDALNINELSHQVILTEADWQNFKQLFEKTYPAFFSTLRLKAPGITEAEQRMAALLKIQLSTKQIAAMQGIGSDSVHKTRHRLRQRFATGSTAELENIIASI